MTFLKAVTITVLLSASALAGQREIIFPQLVLGHPSDIAFVHGGQVGVALGGGFDGPLKVFSFSIVESRVLDAFDISAELGLGLRSLNLHACPETGTLAVASFVASDVKQKIVVLRVDQAGQFSKLWSVSFPSSSTGFPTAIFNEDGTKLWAFYKDEQPKLALLRTEDAAVIATIDLPDNDDQALLVFDKVAKRPIVMSTMRIHLLAPEGEGVGIEGTVDLPSEFSGMRAAEIGSDGRFLFGYGGSSVYLDPPLSTNNFLALDLRTKEFHTLFLKSKIIPSGSSVNLDPATGSLFVPYSTRLKIKKNGFTLVGSGSNLMDILKLGPTGDIIRATEVDVPPANSESTAGGSISPSNNVVLSQSGAMGFLSSLADKRILAFDTTTGEIVNEITVPDALTFIYRPGNLDVLVYANSTNKLVVLDITSDPTITAVQTKRNRTIIKGNNFLFGARVQINGEDLGVVDRSPEEPGHEIIINRGSKDLPADQDINIVVINRDGGTSKTFTFRR